VANPCDSLGRHDVAMQIVGQPARDLARHFVERSVSFCAVCFVTFFNQIRVDGTTCYESRSVFRLVAALFYLCVR